MHGDGSQNRVDSPPMLASASGKNQKKGDTMSLPRFTKDQQKFVVANLIMMTPHREIARKFQRLFPYFVPQDLDQAAYEEAFIKRAIAPRSANSAFA